MVLTTGDFLKIKCFNGFPYKSVTGLTPEFYSTINKDYCLPTPYVNDLSDAWVFSEPIYLTAVEQTVTSLKEGIANCSKL